MKPVSVVGTLFCLAMLPSMPVDAQALEESLAAEVAAAVAEVPLQPRATTLPADWQRGPFMQIYVRGYQDSNGDGTGDLQGLTSRLDYLKSLGVKGLYLLPIYHSQDNNHGYTIRNFRKVEPRYGNEDDVRLLLQAAHARGMGVILDYVLNHSAEKHPLFLAADAAGAPWRDWYVCRPDKPAGWKAYGGDPWQGREGNWCYTAFSSHMRDFNWRNPEVQRFHLNTMRYWLNLGVDGFRFDAVGVLVENGQDAWDNQPENYAIMRDIRAALQDSHPPVFIVCEAPGDPAGFAAACGRAFAFGLQGALLDSVRSGQHTAALRDWLQRDDWSGFATFLANHDAFAGIRLYDQLQGDEGALRLVASLLYTLPGVPFSLYGEEIGMSMASPAKNDDMRIRAPMSWNSELEQTDEQGLRWHSFGGFTRLQESWKNKLFRPQADNWRTHNVAAQETASDSLLHHYRGLMQLRNATPALAAGNLRWLSQPDPAVLAFLRITDGQRVLVVHNLGREAKRAVMPAAALQEGAAFRWQSMQQLWPAKPGAITGKAGKQLILDLAPRQSVVIRLGDGV